MRRGEVCILSCDRHGQTGEEAAFEEVTPYHVRPNNQQEETRDRNPLIAITTLCITTIQLEAEIIATRTVRVQILGPVKIL